MVSLRPVSLSVLLILFLISSGCENKTNSSPSTPVIDIPASVSNKIASLEEQIQTLQHDLAKLELRFDMMHNDNARVSTEEKGYSLINTKHGTFAVSCENVTNYLDGYKVQLSVLNLTSASFNDVDITLTWGKDHKQKKVTIPIRFLPGKYTEFEVFLTPAKPEEIKMILVNLAFNQISSYHGF